MTTPSVVPAGFAGDSTDFAKTKGVDRSGAARLQNGTVTVPSGTAANAYVGLIPFNKGARFHIDDKSIYAGNFGAGTTTINVGYVYDDDTTYTNDPDAFASASTAAQSGGFVTIDEKEGLTFEAEADGWLTVQLLTAAADAEADIEFNIVQAYDG